MVLLLLLPLPLPLEDSGDENIVFSKHRPPLVFVLVLWLRAVSCLSILTSVRWV